MSDESPSPTLAYGVSPPRRVSRRMAVIGFVLIALVSTLFYYRAALIDSARERYHAWALNRALADGCAAGAAGDRTAMNAAWQRIYARHNEFVRTRGGRGTANKMKQLPPGTESLIIASGATQARGDYVICVGVNGEQLFTEFCSAVSPGKALWIKHVDTAISPPEIVPKLRFGQCRVDPDRPNELLLEYTFDGSSDGGVLVIRLTEKSEPVLDGAGWMSGTDVWYPGSAEVKLMIAP